MIELNDLFNEKKIKQIRLRIPEIADRIMRLEEVKTGNSKQDIANEIFMLGMQRYLTKEFSELLHLVLTDKEYDTFMKLFFDDETDDNKEP